jgi:glycosyltransferase involved in cell wall biosynthesis
MNIVFIGPFGLQPKSTMKTRALPLAKTLTGRGHKVTILIPPWDDPERTGQAWEENGVRVVNMSLPPGIPGLFHILLTRALVAKALALQPDVIHFFKPKAYAGLAHLVLWWLRRLGGAPVRLVVDADDWEQAWNEVSPYSMAQKKLFAWQEVWGLRHADGVTVASRTLAKMVAAQRPGKPSTVFYLPNGEQSSIFYRPNGRPVNSEPERDQAFRSAWQPVCEKWQLEQVPTTLLYSRFVEFRLERIVSLVQRVAVQLPEARWVIVGRGLAGEEQALTDHLAQVDLAAYVCFTGWLPVGQLPALFDAVDVAIFPYDDTIINRTKCSVKLIDLLLAGLPVVADAIGQNCEYIEHDVSGILVPVEDDIAFAEAVVGLLRSPDRRRKLGQAAALRIRKDFSWPHLAQIIERAYR